jgi:hypothetical protein
MVLTSSSKSNHPQVKAMQVLSKIDPPVKKAGAILMAKTKKTKEQSTKKHACMGKYFFYQVVTYLILSLDR